MIALVHAQQPGLIRPSQGFLRTDLRRKHLPANPGCAWCWHIWRVSSCMPQGQKPQGRSGCLCQCLAPAIPKPLLPDFRLLLLTLLSQELIRTGVPCKIKRCGLAPCFISPDSRERDLRVSYEASCPAA